MPETGRWFPGVGLMIHINCDSKILSSIAISISF